MLDKKDNNIENSTKQDANNVKVGNISEAAGVVIGSNIHVEGGINVTTVIQEIKSSGLKFLPPDYFQLNKRSSYQGFDKWKNGFPFKLQDIMHGHHFQRTDIINEIINKLDDNNGDHALLLLGKSGTSKSILLMDIICHYFKNDFIVFYNFGEEEIKDVYDLEDSLRTRLKDGNKILVAVDNIHDKKTATIFSVIDSIRSYGEKKDNIRFILTGRQPEFDRFVNDRLDTLSEPVRQSIQNLHKQISYSIPNFTPIEIQSFLERYKNEDEVKGFVTNNNFDYNKLFIENDQVTLNNISSLIYEKTNGDPILLKFFIFGKGFANDVEYRFFNYMKSSDMKLQSMLLCVILDRAEIPISGELIDKMNIRESLFELTDETLTFLEDEDRWKTIHSKWDLELLAYLYNIKDYAILEKRKKLLRKALELLMDNLSNEKDRFSIFGFLYDSTTIDTENNQKLPLTMVEKIVTNKKNLIDTYLNENSRYILYGYYIAKIYFDLKLFKEALDATEKAIKISPNKPSLLVGKGMILDEKGQYQEAIKCYDEIITKLDPKYVIAWNNKGIVLGKLQQYKEEIKCYDEIITKLDPKYVSAWYNKGFALGNLGQYKEEIKCYDEIITKLDPKYVSAWYMKGNALYRSGQYQEAIKCYDEIITKLDPKYVSAWYNKGWALTKLRRYHEAIEYYDKALEIDSNDKYALDGKGYTLINLGRYDEAIEYFNKALNIDPNYAVALEHKKISEEKLRNKTK
jgi:tetratricopeptide (TPR) repeat protein